MPRLDDSGEALLHAGRDAKGRVKRVWDDFTDFLLSDNVLEVAVGLILAAAFTSLIKSFVSDLLLPIISLLPFINKNFEEKFAVLRKGPQYDAGYNTLKQALEDGAVVMAYGTFIDTVINFFGIGVALYTIAQVYTWTSNDAIIKHTVKCKFCRKRISEKVVNVKVNLSMDMILTGAIGKALRQLYQLAVVRRKGQLKDMKGEHIGRTKIHWFLAK